MRALAYLCAALAVAPASAEEAAPARPPVAEPFSRDDALVEDAVPPAPPPSDAPPPDAPPSDPHDDVPAPEPTDEEMRRLLEAIAADQAGASSATPEARGTEPAPTWGADFSQAMGQAASALQGMNPEIALILDVAGAWFSDDKPLQLGGHDPRKSGFTLQQLEMAVGASVDPFLRFDANLVFSQFGVEVEEAYATTTSLPWNLQLRAGQFLTRFGRINATHPHAWSFVDQPLVIGKLFGSEGNRGLGAEVSWLAPLPWFAEVVVSATDPSGECCARSYYGGESLGVESPADVLYTGALKQFFPFGDDWSLLWGLSAQTGPNPTGLDNRTEIYGTDLYLRYRPVDDPGRSSLSVQAEGLVRRRQVPGGVLMDAGYYAQAVYQFLLQYEVGARAEGVTGAHDDTLDPTWEGFAQRYALEAAFYPSHFTRLRAQAAVTLPPDGRDPIWAAMVSLEVLVGAHGAHTF